METKLELSPHITVTMVKLLHDIHALPVKYGDRNSSQPAKLAHLQLYSSLQDCDKTSTIQFTGHSNNEQ